MSHTRTYVGLVLSLLIAASLQAVTYVVPSDRDLVRRADVIVIATAVQSRAISTEGGTGIGTLTTFTVDDQLKGTSLDELRVYEPGGSFGDRVMFIPGAPRYVDGTRYLLFLHRMPDGRLTSYALGLGTFNFSVDIEGRAIVARGATEQPLGWNPDGSIYIEKMRDAQAFLGFVRTVARSADAPAVENYILPMVQEVHAAVTLKPAPDFVPSDYLWSSMLRWQNPTTSIGYCCGPTYQPSYDGPGGASTATGMWDGTGVIHYTISGATNPASGACVGAGVVAPCGGLRGSDGANTILFNDPNNELSGFGAGIVALGGVTNASGSYTANGQTFTATHEIDAVIAKTTQFPAGIPQSTFAAVVTHELGHTLGFRHADGTSDPNSPPPNCTVPLPCSSGFQAIMEHIVNRSSLGQWDNDAANTVYGSGAVCTNPSITVQPASTSITAGNSANLSVTATGTSVTYQWFQGNPGSGSAIAGQTGSSLFVTPSATTTYYVVVSACGTSVTSSAATVTVTCQNPQITGQPQNASIVAGTSTTLFVSATGSSVTYQWFQGNPGSGSAIAGQTASSLTVNPSSTTTYYVVVSGCGTSVTSQAATVTVAPCTAPAITNQPHSTSIVTGGSATLTVTATGSNLAYQWFQGTPGSATQLFGQVSPTLVVNPTATTTYFVIVTGACGSATSQTATVTIGPACSTTLSSIGVNPTNPLPGQSFTLTANAATTTGTLSYQWYRGTQGDFSAPLGTTQTITLTQSTASQNYWVVVSSTCGGVAPAMQVTVNLNTGTCGTNPNQMCISNARYRVTLTATDPRTGKTGNGVVNYLSDVFGYFTLPDFSNPGDPQVFVKVLGPVAPPIGQNAPWVFYSGLTDLQYVLTVVDTQTGQTFNSYNVKPPLQDPRGLLGQQTIGDFEVNGVNAHSGDKNVQCVPVQITSSQTTATPGNCPTNGSTLCLLNRFTVTMRAKVNNASGATDNGVTIPANSQFGFFTTPNIAGPTDVQGFMKMLDATGIGQGYWVFVGGLTDFELTYTVTDTATGKRKVYLKPAGSTCGWSDVPNAF